MDFQEFWVLLTGELVRSRRFQTIKQSKGFDAHMQGGKVMVTPDHTGKPRPIGIAEFQEIWDAAKNDSLDGRLANTNKRFSHLWNP